MKRWAEWHCVDDELSVVGEIENDDFYELCVFPRADDQNLRRVGIGIQINDDSCVLHGVDDVRLTDAVTSSRTMKLHLLNVIRYLELVNRLDRVSCSVHRSSHDSAPLRPNCERRRRVDKFIRVTCTPLTRCRSGFHSSNSSEGACRPR